MLPISLCWFLQMDFNWCIWIWFILLLFFCLFLHWIINSNYLSWLFLCCFLMHHGKKKNEDRLKLCLLNYFIGFVTTIVHVEIERSFSCAMTTYVHHYGILWRWVLLLGIVVGITVECCRFLINAIECCCWAYWIRKF